MLKSARLSPCEIDRVRELLNGYCLYPDYLILAPRRSLSNVHVVICASSISFVEVSILAIMYVPLNDSYELSCMSFVGDSMRAACSVELLYESECMI